MTDTFKNIERLEADLWEVAGRMPKRKLRPADYHRRRALWLPGSVHDFGSHILAQIGVLQRQSARAAAARDRLLPQPMSGEIKV